MRRLYQLGIGKHMPPHSGADAGSCYRLQVFVCQVCAATFPEDGFCAHDGSPLRAATGDPLVGSLIGPYRIEKLIGVGGMGQVYKAVHPKIGSRVAVKVLAYGPSVNSDLIARFFDEARAVNVIRHENIVNILDLDYLPDRRPYIVMEFLDGAPLSTIIANHRQLPIGTLLRMIEDVLSALGAAHAEQIVHRDLKPDNIFVSPKGRPKVLDFGIAKLAADQTSMKGQTKEGSLLGTPHYMSPEQALGQAVDARSDIYSIGVILYECATGQTPFQSEGLFSLLQQHVSETPGSPRLLRPDISDGLEAVIMRALEKDPAKRWQNVSELAFALQKEQHGLPDGAWAPIGMSGESSSSSNRPSQPPSGVGHLSHASPSVVSAPAATGAKTHLGSRAAVMLLTLVGVAALVAVLILSQMDDATQSVAAAADLSFDAGSEPAQEEALFDAGATVSADTDEASADSEVADTDTDTEVAETSKDNHVVAAAPVKEAQDPRKRQGTVKVSKVDPNKLPASLPAQPPTKATPVAASKAAPKDAVPVRDSVGTKSASNFNMTSYFPTALARARKAFPDAVLVRIDAQGVLPSGNANLTLSDDFDVTYRFISPSRAKRPADLPLGMEHKPTCLFYVNVTAKETDNYALTGWKCSGMTPLGRPRCSAKEVWKRAIADGAPKSNAVAELGLRGGKWWFDIKGTYSKTFPDDC